MVILGHCYHQEVFYVPFPYALFVQSHLCPAFYAITYWNFSRRAYSTEPNNSPGFLHPLHLPRCLTPVFFVGNAPIIWSFPLLCFANLPNNRTRIQGGFVCSATQPFTKSLSGGCRLFCRCPFCHIQRNTPCVSFLLLISNLHNSSPQRLSVSIITIFSHHTLALFQALC